MPMYAVQVQDVSLIFQSAIATSIAGMCTAAGYKAEEALGTVLMTLVIATFVVGVLIVAVGARMHDSKKKYLVIICTVIIVICGCVQHDFHYY